MTKNADTDAKKVAEKFAASSREIEEIAARVANKTTNRRELTGKVTDSAAELSNYILKRARSAA